MSNQINNPLKRASDNLDLASIPVQGEPAAKTSARRALRFVLGTSVLFPRDKYTKIDVDFAVSVTDSGDLIRARLLRPVMVLVAAASIAAAAPAVASIVRHEYSQLPAVDQSGNPSDNQLLTPDAPTVDPASVSGYDESLIWQTR